MSDLHSRTLVFACLAIAPVLAGARGGCGGGTLAIGSDAGAAGRMPADNPAGGANAGGAPSAGTANGASPGTGGGEPGNAGAGSTAECASEEAAVRQFLEENKACSEDSDCRSQAVGCGVTEDGCTGTVYVNQSTNEAELAALRSAYATCMSDGASEFCVSCNRVSSDAACVAGRCLIRPADSGKCENEERAVREFVSANKACDEDSDCRSWIVGCGVTEDDCTGAVFVNRSTDTSELDALKQTLELCTGGCGSCRRGVGDGACVSGLCQNYPPLEPVRVVRGDPSGSFWDLSIVGEDLEEYEGKSVRVLLGHPDRPPERLGSGETQIRGGAFELSFPQVWEANLYKQKLVLIDVDGDGSCDPARDTVVGDSRATYIPKLIVSEPAGAGVPYMHASFYPERDCLVFNSSWPTE
jgi:hypothetical protein